ncbi:hypothetical protein [Paenibacillus agricola]|uniref:hypothetical protein n=1 Tax=Paenibacillus agricola TaxID=2716264 RepID=UPI001A9D9B7B|nr:hypothetical protein [Paenibacillus agricola]
MMSDIFGGRWSPKGWTCRLAIQIRVYKMQKNKMIYLRQVKQNNMSEIFRRDLALQAAVEVGTGRRCSNYTVLSAKI